MNNLPPKQQVLILLEQCLATGVRGRVAEIVKNARAEIAKRDEFTDQFYANATHDVSDPSYPGLFLKVGKRSRRWIYRYTPKGLKSTKQHTLGYFPQMSVADARQAWQQACQPEAEAEIDKDIYSVSDLVADYVAYARQQRSEWRREQRFLERHFDDVYGALAPSDITPQHINKIINAAEQRAIEQGGHGQRAKEKARSILRHLYDVARGKSHYDDPSLPWIDPTIANPTEAITITRVRAGQLPIFATDVGRYAKALVGLPIHQDLQAMLVLQLATMAPFSILCRLEWSQIDWNNKIIRIADSGRHDGGVIPLSSSAMHLLESRRRSSINKQRWVFTATKQMHKPMPLRYPTQMLAALRDHLQLPTQFTCGRIIRFCYEWHKQQGGAIGQVGIPVLESHFQLLGAQAVLDSAEQWQQHLTNLRQTC